MVIILTKLKSQNLSFETYLSLKILKILILLKNSIFQLSILG